MKNPPCRTEGTTAFALFDVDDALALVDDGTASADDGLEPEDDELALFDTEPVEAASPNFSTPAVITTWYVRMYVRLGELSALIEVLYLADASGG